MKSSRHWRLRWQNEDGNAIVEFALIIPLFVMVVVGGFYTALLMFAASNMQYAVEAGARCASVNSTVCTNSTTTAAYARQRFSASAGNTATFTSSTASCGHLVTGSMTYPVKTGVTTVNVPLAAQACFP
jgi:Flp pilus assembly protein TadG